MLWLVLLVHRRLVWILTDYLLSEIRFFIVYLSLCRWIPEWNLKNKSTYSLYKSHPTTHHSRSSSCKIWHCNICTSNSVIKLCTNQNNWSQIFTSSGLLRTSKLSDISCARSSGMSTWSHGPWATYGCSGSTSVPVTVGATSVIAVSPSTDLNVKCRPCFTRPLERKRDKLWDSKMQQQLYKTWHMRIYNSAA